MYTFDTNIIIYYLNQDLSVIKKVDKIIESNSIVYFSTLSEVELFSFKELQEGDITRINDNLNTLNIVPVDSRIARIAGFLRRNINIKIADSIIAATALNTQSILLTRNVKDFNKIPNLKKEQI
ncbi:MAG: type II toxin-antitoxin system VapC family toxin [Patescibacteria group bacterium]